MTALEERISGLLTAFLNMDAQHSFKSTSAVLVAGQNIVFILFYFLPPFLLCKTSLKHLFIVKQSLVLSVFPHNRKITTQAYEMGQ